MALFVSARSRAIGGLQRQKPASCSGAGMPPHVFTIPRTCKWKTAHVTRENSQFSEKMTGRSCSIPPAHLPSPATTRSVFSSMAPSRSLELGSVVLSPVSTSTALLAFLQHVLRPKPLPLTISTNALDVKDAVPPFVGRGPPPAWPPSVSRGAALFVSPEHAQVLAFELARQVKQMTHAESDPSSAGVPLVFVMRFVL